jgi:thiamine pyrophosphokinase
MYVIIVANAIELDITPYADIIRWADMTLAADGGACPLLDAGILPHAVIGDLDSLDQARLDALNQQGVEIRAYPRAKDETDLELALLLAVERGATQIDILGALGGRWDHTLANVALLAHPALSNCRVRLLADRQELFLVRDVATIEGRVGDTVSLLPLTGNAGGVTTRGLLYPLKDATLRFDQARGVSNVLIEPPCEVALREGILLVVHHDDGGMYQWNVKRET